jgi:CHC2-type zinc finger protein/DNA primase RepB-like protein
MSESIPQIDAALLMAATLAGNAARDHLLEIRCPGNGQRFFPVGDYRAAASFGIAWARSGNVYISALPRIRRNGSKDDVESSWVLWTDVDHEDGIDRVAQFAPVPSIVIKTGTPGHALAIWQLREPLQADQVKPMNRRLAHALGGDLASTDAARVLRLPGTLNLKHDPARPVRCVAIEPYSYAVEQVVGHLPDPPAPPRPPRRHPTALTGTDDDVLLTISPTEYVAALTGHELGGDSMVRCPFHANGQERTPSLHAWDDPADGWFCFGCERGGTIIDFGAELYGIAPRGVGYYDIRRRLAADLLRSMAT